MLKWFRKAAPDVGAEAAGGVPRSPQWESFLKNFLRGKSCIACGQSDGLTGHHVIPFHVDKSKELDPANIVPICADNCHLLFGHLKNWQWWNVAVREDCSAFYAKRKTAAGRTT
ncbi:HNHc domain containing protein [uncultured Caudovirales phage]|uniref:HNHc domain containing protein n=1 Tax=uncultured Caudovirales phage TaxID=2100421 RepID=A0A6J5PJ21_9CAUD|nr:HNHc domain containing protein [uncultured Caudovirales phage]CAB4176447.1 HNHc domain containing protein [uncultured Caudovirales phage]CAB4181330.1 HNHc domain containing protein [uncultured Caudovirales phage]CAB4198282.1 HNHc domain containing protein [uncultured Caudovirales phage]CAB4210283.1 HNHc domain containing protein [uncultured Caudovirales phage]